MAERDFDDRVKSNLDELEKLREHVPAVDQARFDAAWQEMYSAVRDYLDTLGRADLGHLEAARPWYEGLAEAVFLQGSEKGPQSSDEIISVLEGIAERVRKLPDPEES